MKNICVSLVMLLLATSLMGQEGRIALVIGNSSYTSAPLKNPVNDANLMATTLQGLGFTVIKRLNVTKAQLEDAVRQFSEKLGSNNVALFYYAGHGMQSSGINYLIPVDARLEKESDLKYQAVNINFVVEEFQQYPQNTNIVILDACRDNPLAQWARGGTRGFRAISPSSGTIIAFATAEGSTASDGEGGNGLFTAKLVQQMAVAQPVEAVFKNTRVEVLRASGGKQSPQEWSMLTGNFQFVKGVATGQAGVITHPAAGGNFTIDEEVLTGTITITSEVEGDFYLDGAVKGRFSKGRAYTLNNIAVGSHTLRVGDWEETITVERDRTLAVTAATLAADMAYIPAGTFTMGSSSGESDETPHTVSLGGFSMMRYEVTFEQYDAYCEATGKPKPSDEGWGRGSRPVINVSWDDANEYARWLSRKTGKTWRLPTEAEWEYAAKGGQSYTYSGSDNIDAVGWYYSNGGGQTHPVGQKQPNGYGLYDMTGNVWEWCADWYGSYGSSSASNPQGANTGSYRVDRGGGWSGNAEFCRVACRDRSTPGYRSYHLGFRLVVSP